MSTPRSWTSVLTLAVGSAEVPDPDYPEESDDQTMDVPALYAMGHDVPLWVAPPGTWFDSFGDGGISAEEVVVDRLRKVFSGWIDE